MKRGRGNPKTMSSTVHGIVAGLALPALAAVCPEALAHDRVGAMESKLRQMQQEMNALQQELDRMRAGEGGQERRMQVDQPSGVGVDEGRRQHPHESCKHDDVRPETPDTFLERLIPFLT